MRKYILFFAFIGLVLTTNAQDIIASGKCGGNLAWVFTSDSVFTISGSGAMEDYYHSSMVPWRSYRSSIVAVVIGDSVTGIGDWAFAYCTNLPSVRVPKWVAAIGTGAFEACSSLLSIDVDSNNMRYSSKDGILYTKRQDTLLCCPAGKTGAIEIPDAVIVIWNRAFYQCRGLISVTLPNSVTVIGNCAFDYCTNLTFINIPDSVIAIGDTAFRGCSKLTSVNIPNSVTTIGESAFKDCSSLTSANIPDLVTTIEYNTFNGCYNLIDVSLGKSVSIIRDCAFFNCSSLPSINIPDLVTFIGSYAFQNCNKLTSVNIPNLVTTISHYAFYGCERLVSVSMGESMELIGDWAFGWGLYIDTIICKSSKRVPIIYENTFKYVLRETLIFVPCYRAEAYRRSRWGWGEIFVNFIEMCNGIDEVVLNEGIKIYPNPASSELRIHLPNPSERGAYEGNIEIYNVVGQCVFTSPNPSKGGESPLSFGEGAGVRLDISHLAKGMYFLKVGNRVGKFVKE
jgi:hypothetical protein